MAKFLLFKCIDDPINDTDLDLTKKKMNTGKINVITHHFHKQNFIHSTIKPSDLAQLKMPYINCNREILSNSDRDFINFFLLDKNLQVFSSEAINIFRSKIENLRHPIACMLEIEGDFVFELPKKNKYISENLLGIELNSAIKKCLNEEFIKNNNTLKHSDTASINKVSIQILLGLIDSYVFEDLEWDISFLYRLKPSIIFSDYIKNGHPYLDKTKSFMIRIINTYKKVLESVEYINLSISETYGS